MKRLLSALVAAAMLALTACGAGESAAVQTVGSAVTESESSSAASAAPATSDNGSLVASLLAPTPTPTPTATPVPLNWAPTQKVTMIVAYKAGSSTD
ncbi:MAG: hypothetical protein PHO10_03715 [Gemmiger sp.]|nr:hypothetical protein [Gemmiger sp.]